MKENKFNPESTSTEIINWLSHYLDSNKLETFVIGVSGGIDSAVTSTLCAKTGKKTIVVGMPILQEKSQKSRSDKHMDWLVTNFSNVKKIEVDLTKVFVDFSNLFDHEYQSELSLANSRSRLRMVTLYQIAASKKGLVVGTGNKVEDFGVGFYTKYGDGGVDISPIADLLKSEVRELGNYLCVNQEIILAKPTDGLWGDDRTDEDQIGATYDELEWAMDYIEKEPALNIFKNVTDITLTQRQQQVIDIYLKFNSTNKHKMLPIPIFKKQY